MQIHTPIKQRFDADSKHFKHALNTPIETYKKKPFSGLLRNDNVNI